MPESEERDEIGRYRRTIKDWYESVRAWPGMEEKAEAWYRRAVETEERYRRTGKP